MPTTKQQPCHAQAWAHRGPNFSERVNLTQLAWIALAQLDCF